MKRTPLISLIAMMIVALATTACEKKNQDAEIAALHAQLEAAQAALETAKSGNATPEEIKKLETAVATAAQQEAQAETRKTAATTPAATATAPTSTPAATTTAPKTDADQSPAATGGIKAVEEYMAKASKAYAASPEAKAADSAQAAADAATRASVELTKEAAKAQSAMQTARSSRTQTANSGIRKSDQRAAQREERDAAIEARLRAEAEEQGMTFEEYIAMLAAEQAEQAAAAAKAREAATFAALMKPIPADWIGATLILNRTTARRGQEATVTIDYNHPGRSDKFPYWGVCALDIGVRYDSTRLRIDSPNAVQVTGLMLSFVGPNKDTYNRNPFTVAWFGATSDNYTIGKILSMRFTVLPDAPPGIAYVTVDVRTAVDYTLTKIPMAVAAGFVTVEE